MIIAMFTTLRKRENEKYKEIKRLTGAATYDSYDALGRMH